MNDTEVNTNEILATLVTECQRLDDEHTVLKTVFDKIDKFLCTLVAETLIFGVVICYIFWTVRPL